eukprot:CAMPEP_0174712454 /NCGR_PEP_ID=MMETSP1094-20130205/13441_1 /TAXON_ID=156173 /ORGANISM="Chrysochromulina brevifilum, Strain UTEX LB 985" /LENGTH=62 /DNA_ID=CAMNT_0015911523 /DNA_START=185 /DNA_END=373 /DNA_ORIENTATION=+
MAWVTACEANFWIGRNVPIEPRWTASAEQQLKLLVDDEPRDITFDRLMPSAADHPACISPKA